MKGLGERRIEAALSSLVDALSRCGAPWMIIGGIAIIARGVRRMTTDIDAVVRGDAVEVDELVRTLAMHAIRPRIDDALAFARENLVLLLRHEPTGVDLDVSLAWSGFEHAALDCRTDARFGAITAPMATPEDLVVFKAIAARPKDVDDAETLLTLYPAIDVARVRRRVVELAELAGADDIVPTFDGIMRRVTDATKPVTRTAHVIATTTSKTKPKARATKPKAKATKSK